MNNPVFLYGQIAQEKAMRPDETVACRNATVFQDKDGNFDGWIDNDGAIASYAESEENKNDLHG